MTGWVAKRFWKTAEVVAEEGGFAVVLDGRAIRTPGKSPLVMPTRALALAVADEWQRQEERIDPRTMPMTRYVNTAIDRVRADFPAVVEIVAAYGETDLLCYRAESPAELIARQSAAWDPLLDWAQARYGVRLAVTRGVLPVHQSGADLERLRSVVGGLTPHELTSLHELVSLTGSLVLGLAVLEGQRTPDEAWAASRIDEEWQIEQWGRDEEAERQSSMRRDALLEAARFLELVRMID